MGGLNLAAQEPSLDVRIYRCQILSWENPQVEWIKKVNNI